VVSGWLRRSAHPRTRSRAVADKPKGMSMDNSEKSGPGGADPTDYATPKANTEELRLLSESADVLVVDEIMSGAPTPTLAILWEREMRKISTCACRRAKQTS